MRPSPALPHALPLGALLDPLRGGSREMAALGYFGRDGVLLAARHVAGASDWIAVPPRTVARDALAVEAVRVVLAHTHPSGDARPSRTDLLFTRRLARMLHVLGIELFDHLIVGDTVTSLRAEGLL